jgi:hypothetical protein
MNSAKTFLSVNFGCRVNMAETNQWSQVLIDQGLTPSDNNSPDIILVNTCAITKKGEKESLNKVKSLSKQYPQAKIYVTGCANFDKVKNLPNLTIFKNDQKEDLLNHLKSLYTSQIGDKFSHTHRYLLKVQSGCTQFCSYCIVPFKRNYLWSLSINDAVNTVKKAVDNGYQEVIITGVNLDQYEFGFSNLVEALLTETNIKLISFGSIPINCIDKKFIQLIKDYPKRIKHFFHIPIQSGSNKILSLMNRPYTKSDILNKFSLLKNLPSSREVPPSKRGEGWVLVLTSSLVSLPKPIKIFKKLSTFANKLVFPKFILFLFPPDPVPKPELFLRILPKFLKTLSNLALNKSIQVKFKSSSKIHFHLIKHLKFKRYFLTWKSCSFTPNIGFTNIIPHLIRNSSQNTI